MSAVGERVTLGSHFQWPAILAGAVVAAAASLTLNAFGAGIGLSVVSSAPTWRDSSAVYWFIAGVYLLFVAMVSFAVGGYVAGRMRAPSNIDPSEIEFRDGMHGLAAWGVTVILAAFLALGAAVVAASATSSGGNTVQSVAGEAVIATELDELFRTGRAVDLSYRRTEAARILLKSSSHNGVLNPDRRYLTTIVSIVTGAPEVEAQDRVDHAITASAQALHRARVAAVLQAFFVAAALFVGAVVAWYAATEGGRERAQGTFHFWEWSGRRKI